MLSQAQPGVTECQGGTRAPINWQTPLGVNPAPAPPKIPCTSSPHRLTMKPSRRPRRKQTVRRGDDHKAETRKGKQTLQTRGSHSHRQPTKRTPKQRVTIVCKDNNSALSTASSGFLTSCAKAKIHCRSPKITAGGVTVGSKVRSDCPVTCGTCTAAPLEHSQEHLPNHQRDTPHGLKTKDQRGHHAACTGTDLAKMAHMTATNYDAIVMKMHGGWKGRCGICIKANAEGDTGLAGVLLECTPSEKAGAEEQAWLEARLERSTNRTLNQTHAPQLQTSKHVQPKRRSHSHPHKPHNTTARARNSEPPKRRSQDHRQHSANSHNLKTIKRGLEAIVHSKMLERKLQKQRSHHHWHHQQPPANSEEANANSADLKIDTAYLAQHPKFAAYLAREVPDFDFLRKKSASKSQQPQKRHSHGHQHKRNVGSAHAGILHGEHHQKPRPRQDHVSATKRAAMHHKRSHQHIHNSNAAAHARRRQHSHGHRHSSDDHRSSTVKNHASSTARDTESEPDLHPEGGWA